MSELKGIYSDLTCSLFSPAEARADSCKLSSHQLYEPSLCQIRHFYKADPAYGEGVAAGLGIESKEIKSEAAVAG